MSRAVEEWEGCCLCDGVQSPAGPALSIFQDQNELKSPGAHGPVNRTAGAWQPEGIYNTVEINVLYRMVDVSSL